MARTTTQQTAAELRKAEQAAWELFWSNRNGPNAKALRAAWVAADAAADRAENPDDYCASTHGAHGCERRPGHPGAHKAWPGSCRPGVAWPVAKAA
jgi:hypothetical protein